MPRSPCVAVDFPNPRRSDVIFPTNDAEMITEIIQTNSNIDVNTLDENINGTLLGKSFITLRIDMLSFIIFAIFFEKLKMIVTKNAAASEINIDTGMSKISTFSLKNECVISPESNIRE